MLNFNIKQITKVIIILTMLVASPIDVFAQKCKHGLEPLPESNLGDVRYSVLNKDTFQEVYGKEWLPMNGQTIQKDWEIKNYSASFKDRNKLPDARHNFVRLNTTERLNEIEKARKVGSVQSYATKLPTKNPFEIKDNQDFIFDFGVTNPQGLRTIGLGPYMLNLGSYYVIRHGTIEIRVPKHSHTITGGDDETRPKNVALNAYIKVRLACLSGSKLTAKLSTCGECFDKASVLEQYECFKSVISKYENGQKKWTLHCLAFNVASVKRLINNHVSSLPNTASDYLNKLNVNYPNYTSYTVNSSEEKRNVDENKYYIEGGM